MTGPRQVQWIALVAALVGACQGSIPEDGATVGGAPSGGSTSGGGSSTGGSGGAPVRPQDCQANAPSDAGVGRWRRLTIAQYENTVRDLLGVDADTSAFLQDSKTGAFATNADLPPQSGDIDAYQTVAEKVAASAIVDLPRLLGGCDVATTGEDACAAAFISDFGARAYRRSLSESQRQALTAVYQVGKAESFAKGIELVVEAALQAPEFVYLVEVGSETGSALRPLDDFELASRLSYLLWDTMPDAQLAAKARNGTLRAELTTEAGRLMQDDRHLSVASSFHEQLLRVDRLARPGVVTKAPEVQEKFDTAMRSAMLAESRAFIRHVLTERGGTVKALLTAPVAFPTEPLLSVYDLPGPTAGAPVEVRTRSGFLTLPAVMAAVPPLPTRHQAVMRGNLLRRELLCDFVPPPNVAISFELPPNAAELSNQELLRVHKENPSCSGCHELMDPIGFGFEAYDGLGRYAATTAQGDAVDTTGYVEGLDGGRALFDDAVSLGNQLAASPEVRSCLAKQWFRFALARDPLLGDECSFAAVDRVLASGDGDIHGAIVALVESPAFRHRKVPQ
jgi:Protein of unknown function (DUF1592)/Protein of unknown function (DUF1588)/Protein of unknown function (DUF1595)/Protein of unknown function (DUF1587)/Protein of unknown function (DUF1585)